MNEPNNIIDQIISSSKKRGDEIRTEFDKLVKYYSSNREDLLNALLDVKHDIKNEDYFSSLITNGIDDKLDRFQTINFSFNEEYLLDSIEKIHKQFIRIPSQILNNNENIKILFYDLMSEPDIKGLRLVMLRIIINWKNFHEYYSSIYN